MPEKLPVNDVVVLLPGILGSVLQQDGSDVWAMSPRAAWRSLVTLGQSVKDLELKEGNPEKLDLGDGVQATRLMPDLHLVPGFWKIDGYGKVKRRLFEQFDFTDGVNWFDFPYDWRRDNRPPPTGWPSRRRGGWRPTGSGPGRRRPDSCCSAIPWADWWPATSSRLWAGGR